VNFINSSNDTFSWLSCCLSFILSLIIINIIFILIIPEDITTYFFLILFLSCILSLCLTTIIDSKLKEKKEFKSERARIRDLTSNIKFEKTLTSYTSKQEEKLILNINESELFKALNELFDPSILSIDELETKFNTLLNLIKNSREKGYDFLYLRLKELFNIRARKEFLKLLAILSNLNFENIKIINNKFKNLIFEFLQSGDQLINGIPPKLNWNVKIKPEIWSLNNYGWTDGSWDKIKDKLEKIYYKMNNF